MYPRVGQNLLCMLYSVGLVVVYVTGDLSLPVRRVNGSCLTITANSLRVYYEIDKGRAKDKTYI
jgi:hypothetical protein